MGALSRFEKRVQETVSGVFAKAFKSEVQPTEIGSALQRECAENATLLPQGRTMVPNDFVVDLSEQDYQRLQPHLDTLRTELADLVRGHAREQRYTFVGPVQVQLQQGEGLDLGVFRVHSSAVNGPAGMDWSRGGAAQTTGLALEANGLLYPLTAPVMVIGRGEEADIQIDDPGISRRHAQIHRHPQDEPIALMVDMGSTNGINTPGGRQERVELHDGDAVILGSTTVIFRAS